MSDIPLVDSSARLVEGSTTPGLVTAQNLILDALLKVVHKASRGTYVLDANFLDGIESDRFLFGSNARGVVQISDDASADAITKAGFYCSGGNLYQHLQFSTTDTYAVQFRWPGDSHQMFMRYKSTTWGAWQPVWNGGNDGPGSGLDADLVRGCYAHIYYGAYNDSADWKSKEPVTPGTVYLQPSITGMPTSGWWKVMFLNGTLQGGDNVAIAANITGTGLYSNTKNSGNWGSWVRLWSEGNDGNGGQQPAPKPTTADTIGRWQSVVGILGGALSLPAGGTWAYMAFYYSGTNYTLSFQNGNGGVTVAAGGTQICPAQEGFVPYALGWRIA